MATLFARSVLAPLNLAPQALSKVHILLSPGVSSSSSSSDGGGSGDGDGDGAQASAGTDASASITPSALPDLVAQCPSLADGHFVPSPHLPAGHAQTIYSTLANTVDIETVHYVRHVLLLPEGGLLSLDICDNEPDKTDEGKPTVVILHGLTGGSQESYLRHCVKHLAQPTSEGGPGYRCIVVNFRGCANTPLTSSQLYSAAKTSDFRCGVLYISQRFPKSPLIGLGFSLGANILSKYLGEEGDATPLIGGIACAAPYDLKKGSDLMENNSFRRHVYSRAMNGNLCRVARRHAATLDLHEPLRDALDDLLDPQRAKAFASRRGESSAHSSKTLKFVDDVVTRFLGGYSKPYGEFPFEDADDYYRHGGAINTLKGLRRPLLSLNAEDDPIVAAGSIAGLKRLMGRPELAGHGAEGEDHGHTDYIVLATTKGGGHLGWWQGYRRPTRWLQKPVVEFTKALVNETAKRRVQSAGQLQSTNANEKLTTHTTQVLVELIPASLLPPYVPVSERDPLQAGATDKKQTPEPNGNAPNGGQQTPSTATAVMATVDRHDPAFAHGARLPWLRTHVLEHAPLLHPSMARQGWCGHAPATQKDFDVDAGGRMCGQASESGEGMDGGAGHSNAAFAPDVARGWCAFEAPMLRHATRPEVGFLELPPWTRVAGAGESFQGGRDEPGLYGMGDVANQGGGVAGL